MSILLPILKERNKHPLDEYLVFDEPTHKYTITTDPTSKYMSVTTWNHHHFAPFDADTIITKMMKGRNWNSQNKYWGKTPEEIKQGWADNAASVSGAGTALHYDIECFMNQPLYYEDGSICMYTHEELLEMYEEEREQGIPAPNLSEEWQYFLQFVRDYPHLKPYRTEWMIYDTELKFAGSIDMVYENEDGTLMIYDWKRAKEINKSTSFGQKSITSCIQHVPDTNFWHYSLQLNTYKALLEKIYNKKVTDLFLVRLHPNHPEKTYELIRCADMQKEIHDLFDLRREMLSEDMSTELSR